MFDLREGADHVESLFGAVVEFVGEDAFAAIEGIVEFDSAALLACEGFGGGEGLGQKAFEAASAKDHLAFFAGEFDHAEHGDDIFEVFVDGERASDFLSDLVVALTDDGGGQHLGTRLEGIDGGIKPFTGAFAREDDRSRKVGKGVNGGRIGEVVGRDIDRLNGGDGARLGVADALFELSDIGSEGRLVADTRGQFSHQAGDFGS